MARTKRWYVQVSFTLVCACTLASGADAQSVHEVEASAEALRNRIEVDRAKISQTEAELKALEQTEKKRHARVSRQARALYRLSRAGWLPLSGGAEALLAHFSRVQHLHRVVEKEAESLTALTEHRVALEEQKARLATQMKADRSKLQVWSERAYAAKVQDAQEHDVVDASERDYQERAEQMGGSLVVRGAASDGGFVALRGSLPAPLRESVEVRDGSREADVGLEFIALPEAGVFSIAEGRVAYVGRTAALGTIIIVDHGDRYFSVYAGLGATSIQQGDYVSAGAKLGQLDAGELFFAVRHGARSLDARSWLGL